MSKKKVEKFIEDLEEEGYKNIIILATPNSDSDCSGQIMAIVSRKKEALAMICAAISSVCENDADKEMKALDIIKSAFEDKNKIVKKLTKMKKSTKEELKDLLKELLED